jgi:competence protein ComEC
MLNKTNSCSVKPLFFFNRLFLFILSSLIWFSAGCATVPKTPPAPRYALFVPSNQYRPSGPELTVVFIDVGQGDSIFIKTPGGKTALIDAGGIPAWKQSSFDTGASIVVPFLVDNGVSKLDCVFATHSDGDHIAGLPSVLKKIPAGIVYENGIKMDQQPEYDSLHRVISYKGIPNVVLKDGDPVNLDPAVKFEILSPPKNFYFENDNNNSITIRLVYGDVSFMFTGDLEFEGEYNIIKNHGQDIVSNILKVGHHGSSTSTSDDFFAAVDPEIAVISVGVFNNFGHPYSGTIAKFEDAGIKVYRTDRQGNITVKTDGKIFTVLTEKSGIQKKR